MQDILNDMSAAVGVTGCFVCDPDGRVLASTLPASFDSEIVSAVGKTISQTTAGLVTARRRKIHELDLLFSAGRLIVRPLRGGSLCLLCSRNINVPLLNLTANVVTRKLTAVMKEAQLETQVVPEEQLNLEQLSYSVLGSYPDVVSPVLEYERSLPADRRLPQLRALGQRVGASLFQRRYSSMRISASIAKALEMAAVPAVSPFAIANAQGSKMEVLVCPFCRTVSSPSPCCHFLAGFIQGLLDSVPGLGEVEVVETLCRGKGDQTCTFVATAEHT
jgi:predicted regulator of Ras-like GTPase activity (Roadblock/LC7/MglB family)